MTHTHTDTNNKKTKSHKMQFDTPNDRTTPYFTHAVTPLSPLDATLSKVLRYHWPYDPLAVVRDRAMIQEIRRQDARDKHGEFDLIHLPSEQKSGQPGKLDSAAHGTVDADNTLATVKPPWIALAEKTLGDNPVPNPVSMGPLELSVVKENAHDYWWSIKNDGTRYTLVFCRFECESTSAIKESVHESHHPPTLIPIYSKEAQSALIPMITPLKPMSHAGPSHALHDKDDEYDDGFVNVCYIMDRTGKKWIIPIQAPRSLYLGTILDCEYVVDQPESRGIVHWRRRLILLDTICTFGVMMGHGEEFDVRLAAGAGILHACHSDHMQLCSKTWYDIGSLNDPEIIHNTLHLNVHGVMNSVHTNPMDGLIFMPRSAALRQGTHNFAFKWKLSHTLDFYVTLAVRLDPHSAIHHHERGMCDGQIIVIVNCYPTDTNTYDHVERTLQQFQTMHHAASIPCTLRATSDGYCIVHVDNVLQNTPEHDTTLRRDSSTTFLTLPVDLNVVDDCIQQLIMRMPDQANRFSQSRLGDMKRSVQQQGTQNEIRIHMHTLADTTAQLLLDANMDMALSTDASNQCSAHTFAVRTNSAHSNVLWCPYYTNRIIEYALYDDAVYNRSHTHKNTVCTHSTASYTAEPLRRRDDKSTANGKKTIIKSILQMLVMEPSMLLHESNHASIGTTPMDFQHLQHTLCV